MKTIEIDFTEKFAVVKLSRSKANAINMQMIDELRETFIKLAESTTVDGVILTGAGKMFCAGLDVIDLYGYDDDKMITFWESFGRLVVELSSFPKPLVAAINGHSPAGGCVLALCCDHRVMAYGDGTIGLNEVPVGIVPPKPIVELARFTVGHRKAAQMMFDGLLLNAEEAKTLGLIDEACKEEELDIWAETKLKKWMNMPREPWASAKKNLKRPLLDILRAYNFEEAFGETLTSWWDVDNRAQVGKLVKKLTSK